MPELEASSSRKRKTRDNDYDSAQNKRKRKRVKARDARAIPAQSAEAALSKTGELDIASFVASREYEIKALEANLASSKKELRLRSFQRLPRNMRRRTASHNAKRVPKRLRKKAEREIRKDNTPTVNKRAKSVRLRLRFEGMKKTKRKIAAAKARRNVNKAADGPNAGSTTLTSRIPKIKKNILSQPPKATSRFKKRQVHKTWLPTHLWHAKRAHMTKPKVPLWRLAIPLSPTEKSYRPTHRAAGSRGCIAWDTSYMSTISAVGPEASLKGLLRSVSFGSLPNGKDAPCWGRQGAKWIAGTRHGSGWAQERDGAMRLIAPILVLWCPISRTSQSEASKNSTLPQGLSERQESTNEDGERPKQKPPKRQLFIRVHPSAFLQLWTELSKNSKIQKPAVMLEDLRFEIGSLELTGAGSTECLLGTLRPALSEMRDSSMSASATTFTNLSMSTTAAALPTNALIGFEACDPRLHHPLKTIKRPAGNDAEAQASLAEMLAGWPLDSDFGQPSIFSHTKRVAAARSLSSQRAINRRRTLAPPGEELVARNSDPRIPVMLLATRTISNDAQGSWLLLFPWKCVDVIWRCLMYYPLSTGGQPRFGGLDETRQIAFERGLAWFPGDFPGVEAGRAWLRTEAEIRRKTWERKPPGRKVNFETLDIGSGDGTKGELGNPWDCDWDFVLKGHNQQEKNKTLERKTPENASHDEPPSDDVLPEQSFAYGQWPPQASTVCLRGERLGCTGETKHGLLTVKFTVLTRGTPLPAARIYRLPLKSKYPKQCQAWLSLDPKTFSSSSIDNRPKENGLRMLKKEKLNWRGDFRKHEVYGDEQKDLEKLSALFEAKNPDPSEGDSKSKERNTRQKDSRRKVESKKQKRHRLEEEVKKAELQPANVIGQTDEEDSLALRTSRAQLAQSLLSPPVLRNAEHPPLPGQDDLIGFITSGNYNLAEGRGTGIGSIWSQKLQEGWEQDGLLAARQGSMERRKRLVVIRNVGETTGRLAIWEPLQ